MDASETQERGQRQASAGSRSSSTACLRCRTQKLKCGRERPVCARCQRVDATCSYPSPPNRRGPRPRSQRARLPARAAERSHPQEHTRPWRAPVPQPYSDPSSLLQQESPSRIEPRGQSAIPNAVNFNDDLEGISHPRSDTVVDDASVVLATGRPVLLDSYPNQLRTMSSIAKATPSTHTPDQDQPPLPPTALGLSLLELYFTRIYNAPLLFHKPVLFQQYLEQQLNGALLRALLALATLFLQPCDPESEKDLIGEHTELKVLSIYHASGLPWARAAFKEAMLAAVDSPSLMVIQALECLQHYWFGIGQPYQGNLCLALAYRACHLLGYTKKIPNGIVGLDHDVSLESELARRCFWACWTSTCIVMEPEPYIKSSWQEVAMVPLPGVILPTPSEGYRIMLGEIMDENWNASVLTPGAKPGPAAAILMKMVGVWAKVQLLCKDNKIGSILSERFQSGRTLSQMATSFFDDAKRYRSSNSDSNHESNDSQARTPQDQDLLLVHDALYHQCQISIHSMIVPLFSGIANENNSEKILDAADQRQSATTVAKHTDLLRRLLEPYLSGQRHVSFLPPLVGYAAFVAGIVLLVMEISCPNRSSGINVITFGTEASGNGNENTNGNGRGCRLSTVESILHLLDRHRVYWRALQRPWEILHTALQGEFQKHSTQNLHQQANLQSSHLLAPSSAIENPQTSAAGYCQVTEHLRQQPHPVASMANDPAEEGPLSGVVQHSSGLATNVNNNNDFGTAASEAEANAIDLLISGGNVNVPQDYDWYNLSFAEAGVEQFAGLEPFALFQHGWQTFG
ncbi:hypothetical protein ASPCAL13683 [Aspergillus calidoustus]|uniref:Zn(2)-C6 fungal-type domain-containing protein n=1 Tax=Aspergillus calidoustus TaxID=454130 RepID=A0A0U5GFB1_ASPCI|nr:hypothetical protein ASPCAL13683 [Aspergillus calidoustus]